MERSALLRRLRNNCRRPADVEECLGQLGALEGVKEYSMAITAWGRQRQWQDALRLLEEMKGRGFAPTLVTYNAAIAACGKPGQWERAVEIFEAMQQEEVGIEPDVVSYTTATSVCE